MGSRNVCDELQNGIIKRERTPTTRIPHNIIGSLIKTDQGFVLRGI